MSFVGTDKTLRLILSGTADAAIRFDDLCHLLGSLGFEKRVRGSHHLFSEDWGRGEDQFAEGRLTSEAVPSQAGPGYNLKG